MPDALSIWTIYDHPRDFPNEFVARRFVVDGSVPRWTDDILTSSSLDLLRDEMVSRGLTVINRLPDDDRNIVEVWL
jgi:hypothetical protein